MDTALIRFPPRRLGDGDDLAAARAVEAGVYAAHLLEHSRVPDPRLEQVVRAGEEAALALWSIGLRIAWSRACAIATLRRLPADDLFQDACVALAEAIRRFDHARGVRFTTFAFQAIQHCLLSAGRHRPLSATPTRRDREAAAQLRAELERDAASSIRSAARRAGVNTGAAARGLTRIVDLTAVATADPAAARSFELAEEGTDFLELLAPEHRQVLELRHGLRGGGTRTLVQVAVALHISSSTAARWEAAAIAAARQILDADRTAAPP